MSEWAVVTVIVTLVGLVAAIVSPIVKFNTTITRINATVDNLKTTMESLATTNTRGHDQIWASETEQAKQLAALEVRLAVMERAAKQ